MFADRRDYRSRCDRHFSTFIDVTPAESAPGTPAAISIGARRRWGKVRCFNGKKPQFRKIFLGERKFEEKARLGVQSRHMVDRIDDEPVWL
jgi:hypothetical protein